MSKKSSVAAEAVRYFDLIYNEEKLMIELTAEERYEQCLLKVKPLLDTLFVQLENLQLSRKNKLADAVRYTLNEKKYLYTFLEDGDVPRNK